MKKLHYTLNHLYFKTKCYTIFTLAQILLSFSLITFILLNIKSAQKLKTIYIFELTIAILMIIDIIIYGAIKGFNLGIITFLEYIIITTYLTIFIYIEYKGFDELDENVEIFVMCIRLVLQSIRFFVGIWRIRENRRGVSKSFRFGEESFDGLGVEGERIREGRGRKGSEVEIEIRDFGKSDGMDFDKSDLEIINK